MTTIAKDENNKTCFSLQLDENLAKNKKFMCLDCEKELIYHRNVSGHRIAHFNHRNSECNIYHEPETDEHIQKKYWLYENLDKRFSRYRPEEFRIDMNRPDVLLYAKNIKIAIEIQCSIMPMEIFRERNKKYFDNNIKVLWLLGNNYYKNKALFQAEKRVTDIEIELHDKNLGRVYYLLGDNEFRILPVHFEKLVREYDSEFWSGTTTLKRTKKLNIGKYLNDFNIMLRDDSNYIRFWDKMWWK